MFYYKLSGNLIKSTSCENKKIILFLHGWGCSKKSFEYFERFFFNDHLVLNVDLYGFGETKLPNDKFDIYEYAKNIYLFLNQFQFDSLDIICHSFGARIAIILATCFNIKIKNLIITGGAGLKPKFNVKVFIKKKIYKVVAKKLNNKLLKYKFFGSDDYKNSTNELKRVMVRVVNQHLNFLVKLIKNEINVLLVWGRFDKATPLYMAKYFLRKIKNSKLKIINGDHFCFLSDMELFANIIKKFLYNN